MWRPGSRRQDSFLPPRPRQIAYFFFESTRPSPPHPMCSSCLCLVHLSLLSIPVSFTVPSVLSICLIVSLICSLCLSVLSHLFYLCPPLSLCTSHTLSLSDLSASFTLSHLRPCLSHMLSLSLPASVSLCISHTPSLPMFLPLSLCLSVSLVCFLPLFVYLSLSHSLSLCLSASCPSLSHVLSLSLYLPLPLWLSLSSLSGPISLALTEHSSRPCSHQRKN